MSRDDIKALYNEYFDEMFLLGRSLGLSVESATEVVNTSFTDLWKMGDSIQGEINTKAFLYSSTRNYSLKLLRGHNG